MTERFEPTTEQRRLVRTLSGFGVRHDDIARQIGVDPKTLRARCRDDLDRGSVEATAKVAQSLFQMATQGRNVAAAIFWMKVRAGWHERPGSTAAEQAPLTVVIRRFADDERADDNGALIDGQAEEADRG